MTIDKKNKPLVCPNCKKILTDITEVEEGIWITRNMEWDEKKNAYVEVWKKTGNDSYYLECPDCEEQLDWKFQKEYEKRNLIYKE